ncbi:MAG: iron ABC transporter permease [Bacteroidetes bacterium]|nr:iron ABC transporter permease [Bacteroidota bacterium]
MNSNNFYKAFLPWLVLLFLLVTDLFFSRESGWYFPNFFNTQSIPEWFGEFRFPRVLSAVFAGMALSISGLVLQTLFRNPLAGPYLTGITPGASFAIALLLLGVPAGIQHPVLQNLGITGAGMAGGILVLLLQLYIHKKRGGIFTLLLTGVMFGYLLSAGSEILQTLASAGQVKSFVMWGMGNFDRVKMEQLNWFLPLILFGIAWIYLLRFQLDAWIPGDMYAQNAGISVPKLRFKIILIAGILAGSTTALCGPIGFVGLAAPHLARILGNTGTHHKLMLPTMLWGAILCLAADILAHHLFKDITLNVNAICAIIGAPVVLYVLLRNKFGNQ